MTAEVKAIRRRRRRHAHQAVSHSAAFFRLCCLASVLSTVDEHFSHPFLWRAVEAASLAPSPSAASAAAPRTGCSDGKRAQQDLEIPTSSYPDDIHLPIGLQLLKGSIQEPQASLLAEEDTSCSSEQSNVLDGGTNESSSERKILMEESHKYVRKISGVPSGAAPVSPASFTSTATETFLSPAAAGATAFSKSMTRKRNDKIGEAIVEEEYSDMVLVSSSSRRRSSLAFIDKGVPIDIHSFVRNRTWPVNNSLFEGEACLLLRDHPACDYGFDGEDNVFFELQVQGRFKRKPQGPIYLALELPQSYEYRVAWPIKAILNACIAFIRSWGYKWVHMSFGGRGDVPHISSPAFQAFDRLIISKPGETPPRLGEPVKEAREDMLRRKRFQFHHEIDTSLVYTMSFNHTYLNPVDWKMCGVPVIKAFDIALMTDVMRLAIYEVVEEDGLTFTPTKGDVQSVAPGRHTKRNVLMWVQLRRQEDVGTRSA